MNYLDLFSGIGGFHKGFCDAGWKFDKVYYSEIDKYADQIYRRHFPNAIGLGDVSKIKIVSHDTTTSREQQGIQQGCKQCSIHKQICMGTQQSNHGGVNGRTTNITNGVISHTFAGGIDLITFGFPCQDLSSAGKRAGLKGSRSGLFYEATRLIRECKPRIFIFENVKGLLTSNEGKDFEEVLREIADIGLYDCEWQLVNTSWVLPQNRERIYFIGHLAKAGRSPRAIFPIGGGAIEKISKWKSQQNPLAHPLQREVPENTIAG